MHLTHSVGCLRVSQRQYVSDIGTKHANLLSGSKPVSTPASADLRLVKYGHSGEAPSPNADVKVYRSLVGSLMYTVTPGSYISI